MDATRAVIRRMLLEYETPEFGEEFRIGDKGMYLQDAERWVTWPVAWPNGSPHHDDVRDDFFPGEVYHIAVAISPPLVGVSPAGAKPSVNVSASYLPLFSPDMQGVVRHVTRNIRDDAELIIDAEELSDHETAGWYEGDVEDYFQQAREAAA